MTRENPSSGTARPGSTSEGDQVLWQVLWIDWKEWLFRCLPAVWPEGDEQEREGADRPCDHSLRIRYRFSGGMVLMAAENNA